MFSCFSFQAINIYYWRVQNQNLKEIRHYLLRPVVKFAVCEIFIGWSGNRTLTPWIETLKRRMTPLTVHTAPFLNCLSSICMASFHCAPARQRSIDDRCSQTSTIQVGSQMRARALPSSPSTRMISGEPIGCESVKNEQFHARSFFPFIDDNHGRNASAVAITIGKTTAINVNQNKPSGGWFFVLTLHCLHLWQLF